VKEQYDRVKIWIMTGQFILTNYLERALMQAEYDKLEDGSFFGRIPSCKGVVAFGTSLRECENELHSTLEDWVLVGLKLGHKLPVLDDIDLNKEPVHESVESM
jgi:predicted RNase H-like HicB family nuclease